MLEYARWKYILVGVVLAVAFLFALPNLFGDDFAIQIARKDHNRDRRAAAREHRNHAQAGRRRLHQRGARRRQRDRSLRRQRLPAQGPRHRQRRKDRPEQDLRERDDVRVTRATLDPGAGPARDAAGSRPARRPLSAVPGRCRRRGGAAAHHLRTGFPPGAQHREDPLHGYHLAAGRFGYSQWTARAAACGRRSRGGARRAQEGAARPRVPRRRRWPMARRWIA